MSYYIAIFFSKIFCFLPVSVCEVIGKVVGKITWYAVPKKRRKMAAENVADCLKIEREKAELIAKKSWVRFGFMLLEVLRFPIIKGKMNQYVEIEGIEHLQEGMALGKGGVIATAHCGNWELMGGALSFMGFPIVGVAQKQKEEGIDKFINKYRRLVGMHITYKNDVREMFRMLKDGWYIGLLMDQYVSHHDGIVIDFFGRKTNCVKGPAVLARYKDAPIYPGYITRKKDGTHKVIIHPRIEVPRTKDKEADIREVTKKINDILENHIKKYPEEWFWLHDRWKKLK